ncbi:MAG: quinone-dependent dihydroorotate dehydrogenase [Opitutales bacterium]
MNACYEKIIRPLFFKQDPENAHDFANKGMSILSKMSLLRIIMEKMNFYKYQKPINLFGVEFQNCVGLAAGFDKEATSWRAAAALGFGHTEIGTITKHKQAGNPKPRVFRYPQEEAVVNSFGFPNDGAEAIAARLLKSKAHLAKKIPLGINIGKSKITPLEEAAEDYIHSLNVLGDFASYFCINISSPNTPELRKLQGKEYLYDLLKQIQDANKARAEKFAKPKVPILLKIAPDLEFTEIDEILETVLDLGLDGIEATNTTITRPEHCAYMETKGGLSGKLLFEKSLEVVNYIAKRTENKLPLIGIGGIMSTDDAGKMLDAGAHLVQIYTSLIYRGPFFPRDIAKSARWRYSSDWV